MNPDRIDIEEVDVSAIRTLRTKVLRPQYEEDELLEYDGDDAPDAHHYAAVDTERERIVGVASYLPDPLNLDDESAPIRLRGMAVVEGLRRTGIGSHLLSTTLSRVALHHPGYKRVWAAARIGVTGFYENHGFEPVGETFEMPSVGPHQRMIRRLPQVVA